jgi:hypothetical protein
MPAETWGGSGELVVSRRYPVATGEAPFAARSKNYSFTFRRRSEFAITDTELKLIVAAARMGLSSNPKTG